MYKGLICFVFFGISKCTNIIFSCLTELSLSIFRTLRRFVDFLRHFYAEI